jgi:hypothetical protein
MKSLCVQKKLKELSPPRTPRTPRSSNATALGFSWCLGVLVAFLDFVNARPHEWLLS